MSTFKKLTRAQRKMLKAWRKEMKRQGYSGQEIDAAISSGQAFREIEIEQELAERETDGKVDDVKTYPYVTSGPSQNTGASKYYANLSCNHPAAKMLFQIRESKIYGGARWDSRYNVGDAALIVDLTGLDGGNVIACPQEYAALRDYVADTVPTISLDWPDHGIPPVTFSFWEKLIELLPPGKVVFRCTGGHGRTGTALAALLVISAKLPADEAIRFVRRQHCVESVETYSQREYLRHLAEWAGTQEPLPDKPQEPAPIVPTTAPKITPKDSEPDGWVRTCPGATCAVLGTKEKHCTCLMPDFGNETYGEGSI